tara:strand:- start:4149 stop:5081 length:933 start_codon:yes stop_codon:yes gene_type:complete
MKVIIDTDPGTDDAVAILLALANFNDNEILGITTVSGNVPVERGTHNALRILSLAGRNSIEVYEGCSQPLERELVTAEWVHGNDGLAGLDFPEPDKEKSDTHAVDFIGSVIMESKEKVTIGVLGPMTNIAKSLIEYPDIVKNIEKIVFMGGSAIGGNTTPVAEFNIFVDPQAAKIVLDSGVPLAMMGLGVTQQALASEERMERLKELDTKTALLFNGLMTSLNHIPLVKEKFPNGTPVHDAFVTAYLINPDLIEGIQVNVDVETSSELTMGQTVVDTLGISGKKQNVLWMNNVDSDELFKLIIKSASLLP